MDDDTDGDNGFCCAGVDDESLVARAVDDGLESPMLLVCNSRSFTAPAEPGVFFFLGDMVGICFPINFVRTMKGGRRST